MSYLTLEGYQIAEQLHAGRKSSVYRGMREEDGQAVVLKVLNEEFPPPDILRQFEFEFHVLQELKIPGVVQAYSLETLGHTRMIVMADDGALSLAAYLKEEPLMLPVFWGIAEQLTETAGAIHAAGIVHKDFNPTNIIITPGNGAVKVIDFGIAALVRRETLAAIHPDRLEGTLAYLSPEQTGRMNRSIDYRSDFYALGATFYRMLTGRPPFESRDPVELVHCHIAKTPPSPSELNPEIPPALSAVIMKLLAKNAEDRYQSAAGLMYDLEQCRIHPTGFTPGSRDRSERFQIPEKLYGRDPEIRSLMDAFQRAASGGRELLLLAGRPGIGKSALIQEIQKPLTGTRGLFIQGKFDRLNRSTPYLAFSQAFGQLCRQVLAEPEARLLEWKERILAAVGGNGRVLTDLIPELTLILGEQPEVQPLAPTESQNRLILVFQAFLKALATSEHPVALFLDDVQWADRASLELVQHLWQDPELTHVLLFCAYRDNEVDDHHPLPLMLEKLRQAQIGWEALTLSPLTVPQLGHMLSDTLARRSEEVEELAALVARKTNGNPFFAREFLTALHAQGLVTFEEGWRWELKRIEDAGITDNVVELMAAKINTLADSTVEILKIAGCIGTRCDAGLLAEVCGMAEPDLLKELHGALNEGILLQFGDTLHFVHDRVHEAAYSLLQDDQRERLHYRVGKALQEKQADREDALFQVAAHLNRAAALLSDGEKSVLLDLNLQAGIKAKLSGAYDAAADFLEQGAQLLPEDCWESDYARTLILHTELAETAFLTLKLELAGVFCRRVLEQARTTLDTVKIYALQISHHSNQREYQQALEVGRTVLGRLGVQIPETPEPELIGQRLAEMAEMFQKTTFDELLELPDMQEPEMLALVDILMSCFPPAIITNMNVMILIILKILQLSFQYGNTPSTAYAVLIYSFFIAERDMAEASGYAQHALRLSEKFGQKGMQGKVLFSFGTSCVKYNDPLHQAAPLLKQAIELCKDAGEVQYLGYCYYNIEISVLLSGEPLSVVQQEYYERYAPALYQLQQPQNTLYFNIWRQLTETLQGHSETPELLTGEFFDEQNDLPAMKAGGDAMGSGYALLAKVLLSFLYDPPVTTYRLLGEAEVYLPVISNTSTCLNAFCFLQALTLAAYYPEADADAQAEILEKLRELQSRFEGWGRQNPHIFLRQYRLISAEIGRISGAPMEEVLDLYDQAIAGAGEYESLYEEAIANERAADYFLMKGKPLLAVPYLQEARYCYLTWGCAPKVARLDEQYPDLLSPVSRMASARTAPDAESNTTDSVFVDMATVMKASRAISGEIALERLLTRIMEIIIENAGAQHGCLILDHNGALTVDASADVEAVEVDVTATVSPAESSLTSEAIVRYVFRSGAALILRNAAQEGEFTQDPHIQRVQAKSVLCLPVRAQDRVSGVVYLENNLAAGAFTEARIELLNILLPQVAISLENARLYENISASLREKEVLLKEVHHRVKNNLQVISSLLNLQARKIQDEEARNAFQDSRARLRSMTLIHEQLYRSDDLAFLNFADYARSLTAEIMRAGRLGATAIPLRLELGEVSLTLDRAIPCGLIITELLSNAQKHAFPEGKEGEILLEVQQDAEAGLRIVVADSGVGLPPEFELKKNSSLGLQLVNTLVSHQLKGSISVESQGGARFTIVVPGTRPV